MRLNGSVEFLERGAEQVFALHDDAIGNVARAVFRRHLRREAGALHGVDLAAWILARRNEALRLLWRHAELCDRVRDIVGAAMLRRPWARRAAKIIHARLF